MTTPDLTPTHRGALDRALSCLDSMELFHLSDGEKVQLDAERTALAALRDVCPEQPALEDGSYEVPDGGGGYFLRYVRDGRFASYRNEDGGLYLGGHPLPADVSTWRRIDGPPTATPEQIDEAARVVSGHSESDWATLSEGMKDYYRARARSILAAAGIEASDR